MSRWADCAGYVERPTGRERGASRVSASMESAGGVVSEDRETFPKLLDAGRGKKATWIERVDWVAQNLDFPWVAINPETVPDAAAVSFLAWAKNQKHAFFTSVVVRRIPSRVAGEEEVAEPVDEGCQTVQELIEHIKRWKADLPSQLER